MDEASILIQRSDGIVLSSGLGKEGRNNPTITKLLSLSGVNRAVV